MKYKVGDVVFVNQGRRGSFYRPVNAIGIIINAYEQPGVNGYRVMIVGDKEETFFIEDHYIQEKLDEI
jgi:hypothetical protein